MPIEVQCNGCQRRLRVPDRVAGKRIKCPKCQAVIGVPTAPEAEADTATWQVQTEEGETYGPVSRAELDDWVADGRVTEDCQLLREGADQWQWAGDIYPQLSGEAPAAAAATSTPTVPKPSASKKSGGIDFGAIDSGPAPATENSFDFASGDSNPAASAAPAPGDAAGSGGPFDFGGADSGGTAGGGGGAFDFAAGSTSPSVRVGGKSRRKRGKKKKGRGKTVAAGGSDVVGPKSKVVAGVLGILLGAYGVHQFYLGDTKKGVIRLLVTIFTCFIGGLWGFIEGIMILTGSINRDGQGRLLKD